LSQSKSVIFYVAIAYKSCIYCHYLKEWLNCEKNSQMSIKFDNYSGMVEIVPQQQLNCYCTSSYNTASSTSHNNLLPSSFEANSASLPSQRNPLIWNFLLVSVYTFDSFIMQSMLHWNHFQPFSLYHYQRCHSCRRWRRASAPRPRTCGFKKC